MRLKDEVALITGAGSGIGRESAILFAREGASVVAVDVNGDAAEEVAGAIREAGGRATAVAADVSKAGDAEAMVRAAEESFGKLTVLFNNAGISHADDDDAISTSEDVWDLTFRGQRKGRVSGMQVRCPGDPSRGRRVDHQHGIFRRRSRRRHAATRLH